MHTFRVGTLNINGARDERKRALVFDTTKIKRVDVMFLQETHSNRNNEADWEKEWEGQALLSHNTTLSGGVGLLFSRGFTPSSLEVEHVVRGRCLMVKARLQNHSLVFINIYAPTNGTEKELSRKKVGTVLNGCGDDLLFLVGDFNCTESFLDRDHADPHLASFLSLTETAGYSHGLVDVWRRMHTDSRQYTWFRLSEDRISSARLDRFLLLQTSVFSGCKIMPVGFTDHSLVLSKLGIKNILPKSAHWHFNSSLTQDTSFREVLRHFWSGFRGRKSDFMCLGQWWDRGKTEKQLLCQQYTLNATQDTRRSIRDLETEIVELESIGSSTGERGYIEILKSKKMVLSNLLDGQVQGALVRPRIQDFTEMETPASFFFGLEKKRGQNRVIHPLFLGTGHELVEPGQIKKRAVEFFSSLYESEYCEDDVDEFCRELPRVSDETNSWLDRPLQLDELNADLHGMQGRRAPGVDGLTVEFYRAFWDIVAHDMLEVFNESLASGSLPLSNRRTVVTLLPKKVLEVSSSLGVDTGIISLDQEKTFDRVEHKFLWKVMERFGFNPGFIAMIRVLYSDIVSMLKFNGSLCAPFRVHRGVWQGCALSGMLYGLSLEPLLSKIRACIDGLILPSFSKKIVLAAYEDDVMVMLFSQKDLDVLVNLMVLFNCLSAAKVNWQKSEALAVGRWTNGLPVLPQNLAWRQDGLKYLGVFIGDEATMKRNWLDTIERVEGKIEKWKWLLPRMSYRGRTLVPNNLVVSVLWHRLNCLEPPSGLLAQVQRVLNFFWNGIYWVHQGVLYLPREEGGQDLIHPASRTATFRIQFVQRFLTGLTDLTWRDVARCVFRQVNNLVMDDALFLTNFKFVKVNGLPLFYKSVVKARVLREPVVHRAMLNVSNKATPRLMAALWTRMVVLEHIVASAGPDLTGSEAVALCWLSALSKQPKVCCNCGGTGSVQGRGIFSWTTAGGPDQMATISSQRSSWLPIFGDLGGPLLRPTKVFFLHAVDKEPWNCVKVLNRRGLSKRSASAWPDRLGGDGAHPCWKVLYNPPLRERTGDLQWRILHGAVAMNIFISRMNPAVSDQCPFCSVQETAFHAYSECERLPVLFNVLKGVLNGFNETFSIRNGAGYKKTVRNKWQLLNFIWGEAKMAIYISRKNKIEKKGDCEAASVWRCNIRCRLRLEVGFYEMMNDLGQFCDTWCHKSVLCTVAKDQLHISFRSNCIAAFIHVYMCYHYCVLNRVFVSLCNCK
uniref:Pol-like protein n=1 Tax=Takifugu rubripes TaxID=31033 RepID=Q76IM7_TAKRU|nr:pol-like protein [Takifugu rubripes]